MASTDRTLLRLLRNKPIKYSTNPSLRFQEMEKAGMELPWTFLTRAIKESNLGTIWYVENEDSDKFPILSFSYIANFPLADPKGFYLAYVWTDPLYRRNGIGVPVIGQSLREHNYETGNIPWIVRKPGSRNIRTAAWGYRFVNRKFDFLGQTHDNGYRLCSALPFNPNWDLENEFHE